MALKTFTELVAGDNDQNSPYEESFVALFQDNNHAMKKTPFYLRWGDATAADADNGRDFWKTAATSGVFFVRGGWWPLWILPGMDVLHIRMRAAVSASDNAGRARLRLVIAAPNQTPDDTDEVLSAVVSSIDPTFTEISFTFSQAGGHNIHDRWGRMARLQLSGTMTTRTSVNERLIVKEHPEAVCYWGQTP